MIEVIGGNLFQWDTGRVAQVNTDANVHEVHFTTKDMTYAYVVSTYEKDGTVYCEIPNILLQQEKSLICYEVTNTDGGEMTVAETTLALHKKNKPQDYAYTQDELKNFDRLAALIPTKLSQLTDDIGAGGAKITSVNGVLPDENGNVEVQAGIDSADVARIVKDEFAGGVGYTETQSYSITWNGDTTDKVSAINDLYYKVSDLTPGFDAITECAVYVTQDETESKVEIESSDINTSYTGFTMLSDSVVICYDSSKSIYGQTFPETGIYFGKHGNLYISKLEFTTGIVNAIDLKYIPSTPEFVVDATNLPTDITAWGKLYESLEEAYNSGHDIFLDIYGGGGTKLKLTSYWDSCCLFLFPESSNTIGAYILEVMPHDGGSLKEVSFTTTEVT